MKIFTFIDSTFDYDNISMQGNTLTFYFKSIDSYKETSINKKFINEFEEEVTLKDYLEDINLQRFNKVFKRVKPIMIYHNEDLEGIDIPLVINLSNIPFTQKINILTNPKINSKCLRFQDEFTTGEYITQEEMIDMYQGILKDIEYIKSNNLSQVEAIYYIYQKYKNRIYKKESKNESCSVSRSLNQIMKRDTIVCVGYSNYLNAISSILNLNVAPLSWSDEKTPNKGHQENIAVINDPKYNIKGVFAIDITWDSRKDEYDNNYQNNIRHFLLPVEIDEIEKNKKGLVLPSDNYYYLIIDRYSRYKFFRNNNVPPEIVEKQRILLIRAINELYKLLDIPLIDEYCDLEVEISKIKRLGNNRINAETLKNIINSVTPRSEEELTTIIKSSYHYQESIKEIRLLRAILE